MSTLESNEKTVNHTSGTSESLAAKLFADAHNWFEHQSPTAKTLEITGAIALGTAALALAKGRLHNVEIIAKAAHLDGALTELEKQAAFVGREYLQKPYLVTAELDDTMVKLTKDLTTKYPELNSVVVAGGQANGSYMLRSMSKTHPGSDLDFYLVGHATTARRLSEISNDVRVGIKSTKLSVDGVLNGKNPEIYLDLDNLRHHIENQDYNLMALPFQAAYGKPTEAQLDVLKAVMAHPQKTNVWNFIAEAHAQSLSMHHGTWSLEFNDLIAHDFVPQKVKKFGLPKTPELALKQITESVIDQP